MISFQTRFCTSKDGTRIAFTSGGEGEPLLMIPAWSSSEEEFERAEFREFLELIGDDRLIVWITRRGTSGSQRDVADISVAASVQDALAVAEHLHLGRFALMGVADGCTVACALAADHPERVSRLVLISARVNRPDETERAAMRAFADLIQKNWRMARRAVATAVFPLGPVDDQVWFARLLDRTVSPDMAARYVLADEDVDLTEQLPRISVPALVLRSTSERNVPLSESRAAAAMLPNGRFVSFESPSGLPYFNERGAHAIRDFLREELGPDSSSPSPFRTVLFTDLVGHTEMMARLGDVRGRDVLREHERITRETLREHGGSEIKTMGDGFMASFASVTRAMDCAIALQRAFEQHSASSPEPLRVRVGLNAGEPVEEDGDLFGASVILAARIAAQAGSGEILVPEPVRHLLAGKGFVFADRGEFVPKGFEDSVRLFELRWRD